MSHRWSGWPGAWCLDCGDDDPLELALACLDCVVRADPFDTRDEKFCAKHAGAFRPCPEPGSNRCNPYVKHVASQGGETT